MEYIYYYDSPLGRMLLASDGDALTGVWFEEQKYYAAGLDADHEERLIPVFKQTIRWLDIYFSGEKPDFLPKIHLRTSAFRKEVCKIMLTIPYGKTMTYGEIAKQIAERRGLSRMSAQAVGGAVGHNPISILIPCHRVVGTNGSLTGYAGGMERKVALLKLEKTDMEHMFVPKKGTAI